MNYRFSTQIFRFCSLIQTGSRQFSEEELQAVLELKRRSERLLSKTSENVLKNRCWAKAPVLEVSGRKPPLNGRSKKGKRFTEEDHVEQTTVQLRWANLAERDVDILLSNDDNLYTSEVKAVLYGIIQAIDLNETKVRMKSSNEVVVKVANKKYNANKEAASFYLINRVVNGNDVKQLQNQLKAKLERISEPDKPIKRIASTIMTETEFFKKYRNSIETLKNYSEK